MDLVPINENKMQILNAFEIHDSLQRRGTLPHIDHSKHIVNILPVKGKQNKGLIHQMVRVDDSIINRLDISENINDMIS